MHDFPTNSRYHKAETAVYTAPTGRHIPYLKRRFTAVKEDLPVLTELRVKDGDRLDLIAARTLGDPEQFWRICDSNRALNPNDLLRESGALLLIHLPSVAP